jgi:hypothetical protein
MPACSVILGPARKTEQHMRPLAVAGAVSRGGGARAGQASGAQRRAKAAITWQVLVKKEASILRAGNPGVSQTKLAEEIKFKFDKEAPSHPIIVRYPTGLNARGRCLSAASERECASSAQVNAP